MDLSPVKNVISDALVAKDLVQVTASPVLMAIRMKKAPAQTSMNAPKIQLCAKITNTA